MDKSIKDWTLAEAMEYCRTYRYTLKEGFCEESDCELNKRGICHSNWVHDWNLQTYTDQEIDDVDKILHLFPNAISIERHTNVLNVRYNRDFLADIDYSLFPSIKVGQTVMLKDIEEEYV